jgi:hypothetical protein
MKRANDTPSWATGGSSPSSSLGSSISSLDSFLEFLQHLVSPVRLLYDVL